LRLSAHTRFPRSDRISVGAAWYLGGVCNDPNGCACEVLAARPQGLPPARLADLLRRISRLSARADACRAECIAEAERTGAARREGYGSTTAWLMAVEGEPARVCRSQVAVAAALREMPDTKAAFAAGEVSESRVRLLSQAQALAPEQFAQEEASLVAQAAAASSSRLPQLLAQWKRRADPGAAEQEAERLHTRRALYIGPAWSGMVHISGDLDPEGGMIVLNTLRLLSEGAALDPADTRTPEQRQADALVEICSRHVQHGGSSRPARPQLLVTVPWNTLRSGKGIVDTEAGALSGQAARRLACDATVSRVILDADSVPVEMGRATRVIPPAIRKALDLRDQGCSHPGCDMPARFCDGHHIVHWAEGGRTDLANLRLLCRRHHRAAHHYQAYPQRR
jgi:hypothetical protein